MRHFLTTIMLFSLAVTAFGKISIGQISIQKVLLTINEGKAVRAKLSKQFNVKKTILKGEEDKIRKSQQTYQKQQLVLSDKAKIKKERDLQKMLANLQRKTVTYRKEMEKLENKFKAPIMEKIRVIVDQVSKKHKLDLTFESSTAPLVYAKNLTDLTDEVIKAYDKKHGKKK